jgi:DNA-binding transcriptional regulator YiaG
MRLHVDPEKAAALARLNAADGTGDPKVAKLKAPRTRAPKAPALPRRRKMSALEYRDSIIEMFRLQHLRKEESLPPYDVTNITRYPEAPISPDIGNERLRQTLQRYAWVMKPQGVTAGDFQMWREHYMGMTRVQLAALVRVNERTVRLWEQGVSKIPFAMWWVLHSTLQDPAYFLTRPGFHDFYIDYNRNTGEAQLCSSTWPDIKYTPTELYTNRAAMSEVTRLQVKVKEQDQKIDELTAENTRLRQMLKAGTVAAELSAMHAHIGKLLQQMHTADVVAFPDPEPTSEVIPFARQAQA